MNEFLEDMDDEEFATAMQEVIDDIKNGYIDLSDYEDLK